MTSDPAPTPIRSSRSRWLVPLLGLTLLAALAVGAYANWYLWHPMNGIVPTIGAAALILVGGVGLLIRSRRIRPIALILLVAGSGTILGQNVGPDRPPTFPHETGTLRLVLTGPTAFDASGGATCVQAADASQVAVNPDSVGLARLSADETFHSVYVTIGDMYDYGDPGRRDDHLSVMILVQPAAVAADGKPGETRLTSDAASVLTLAPGHTVDGGSITFANLAIGDPADPARRSELAGTITWTCGPLATGPGPDETLQPEKPAPTDVPLPS